MKKDTLICLVSNVLFESHLQSLLCHVRNQVISIFRGSHGSPTHLGRPSTGKEVGFSLPLAAWDVTKQARLWQVSGREMKDPHSPRRPYRDSRVVQLLKKKKNKNHTHTHTIYEAWTLQVKFIKATLKPPASRAHCAGLSPLLLQTECQLPCPYLTPKKPTSQRSKSTSLRLITRGLNVEKGCGM